MMRRLAILVLSVLPLCAAANRLPASRKQEASSRANNVKLCLRIFILVRGPTFLFMVAMEVVLLSWAMRTVRADNRLGGGNWVRMKRYGVSGLLQLTLTTPESGKFRRAGFPIAGNSFRDGRHGWGQGCEDGLVMGCRKRMHPAYGSDGARLSRRGIVRVAIEIS